jgi:hypothetical protein
MRIILASCSFLHRQSLFIIAAIGIHSSGFTPRRNDVFMAGRFMPPYYAAPSEPVFDQEWIAASRCAQSVMANDDYSAGGDGIIISGSACSTGGVHSQAWSTSGIGLGSKSGRG